MKRLSSVTAMLLLGVALHAAPVTLQQAQERALQFLSKHAHATPSKGMRLAKQQPALKPSETTETAYYVFNIADNGGFVIVSGDDRTSPILGYADSGTFDADRLPDNMKAWLEGYAEQMAWTESQTSRKAPSVRRSVAPLITTSWNQTDPYNRALLDTAVYKDVVYTGCVATAMAQLMNYHARQTGRPDTVVADIPGYISWSRSYGIEGISAGDSIDWANMLDAYTPGAEITSDEQQRQVDAVAKLFRICGTAVRMDYGLRGSYTDTRYVPVALRDYFGYSEAMNVVSRSDYSLAEWDQLIFNELTQQRPVLLGGASSGGGHAFLVDGFDGDELFHINWGWGGHCDGYYLLGLANPTDKTGAGAGNSYDGYVMQQMAVIGIQPAPEEPVAADALQLSFSNVRVSGRQVAFSAYNYNLKTACFQLTLATVGDDGKLSPMGISETADLPMGWGYPGLAFNIRSGAEGTTKLVLASRVKGTDEWLTRMNPNNNYIEMVVADGNMTLSLVEPNYRLALSSLKLDGKTRPGKKQKVEARVSNTGDEFYGNLRFITQVADTIPADTCIVGAVLPTGKLQTLLFEFTPKVEGRYATVIETVSSTPIVIYSDTIEVAPANEVSTAVDLGIDIAISNLNARGNAILGNSAHVVMTVTNDTDVDYEGLFVPLLVEPGNFSYMPAAMLFEAHTTTVVENDFDVEPGKTYIPLCMTSIPGRAMVTQPFVRAFEVAPAVTIYLTDGTHSTSEAGETVEVPADAVAVDFRGNGITTSVTPSTNPNCLYYFSEGIGAPEGLAGNVVVGAHADTLRVSDLALPLKPIADFSADTVFYTRTFDAGVVATVEESDTIVNPAWETICLPFNADRVLLADSTEVRWLTAQNDSTYNFWLMEFLGNEYNTLFFAPAEEFQAYTPYLICVPGAGLKDLADMTGTPVTFCGHNATLRANATACVAASSRFKMVGTMATVADSIGTYSIAPDGTRCQRDTLVMQPFRAYVKAMSTIFPPAIATLSISPEITVTLEPTEEPPVAIPGDVNGDGTVDVADISSVISIMAGTTDISPEKGDVNGDGSIDVADISSIISIMAGQ